MFEQPKNKGIHVQPHTFSKVPRAEIPRSSFNRSHGYKTTMYAGQLIPIYVDEALPGDTFNLNLTTFARMATPIAPLMDNLYCDIFFFAVPKRLLWNNWEKFNGAQTDPGDSTDFIVPQMVSTAGTGYSVGSLHDYLGLPVGVPGLSHASFWHRAYNLIWNEWFRDQNLQDALTVEKGDGPDLPANYTIQYRGRRHDYFTSALPWPQKGTAVTLPLGVSAPVFRTPSANTWRAFIDGTQTLAVNGPTVNAGGNVVNAGGTGISFDPSQNGTTSGLYADLNLATAATINQLREAFQMQKMFERDARGGTRYTEVILSHFGVQNPDFRLQRPEFLGGGSSPINISAVPQTSSTDATTPQGNLAATGTFSHTGIGFTKSFTEHCVLLGLASIRADQNYYQGLNRMFSRRTRFEYYWPALAHLGEQAVLKKEIVAQGTLPGSVDDEVFGYQERYAEYRYKPNQITGLFRPNVSGSLDVWHVAEEFNPGVELGDIIEAHPPIGRVIAVPSEPHFLYDSAINLICARPMPVYSVPGQIDRL